MVDKQVFDNAEVAELVDAHGSGPCGGNSLGVQIPPSAPSSYIVYSISYIVRNKAFPTTKGDLKPTRAHSGNEK